MKRSLLLVSLLALGIFFASCKKDYIKPQGSNDLSIDKSDKKIKDKKCKPLKIACPINPWFSGMQTVYQGFQVNTYVYDLDLYILNSNADSTGEIIFTLNGQYFLTDSPLVHTDGVPVAIHVTIAVINPSFSMTGTGYATPIRCDCDPSINTYGYAPTATTAVIGNAVKDVDGIRVINMGRYTEVSPGRFVKDK